MPKNVIMQICIQLISWKYSIFPKKCVKFSQLISIQLLLIIALNCEFKLVNWDYRRILTSARHIGHNGLCWRLRWIHSRWKRCLHSKFNVLPENDSRQTEQISLKMKSIKTWDIYWIENISLFILFELASHSIVRIAPIIMSIPIRPLLFQGLAIRTISTSNVN